MPDSELEFVEVDPATPAAAMLMAALDRDLNERYPGMPIEGIEPAEFRRSGGVFLLGKRDGIAVACGALRPLSDGAGELKRMFVRPGERRQGVGRKMLAALEGIATARGYRTIRLGTGTNQPEAMRLYQSAGYRSIPCFGEYLDDDRSRCFEKRLARAGD